MSSSDLSVDLQRLSSVARGKTYGTPESFLRLPFDKQALKLVADMKKKKRSARLKWFVLAGIGGSSLGAKAVYDALFGTYDVLEPQRFPKLLFADTVDAGFLTRLSALIRQLDAPDEILVNIASKSGTTMETSANASAILSPLHQRFGHVADRIVVTTDFNSPLWIWAHDDGADALAIPDAVGGRFSVFSAAGLFPLTCVGADVKALLAGARSVKPADVSASASAVYEQWRRGKSVHNLFVFHPALESLGKWWRQLIGESLGKNGKGFTPIVSVGSTDLHSVGQLYLDGPRDKFTTFVSVARAPEMTRAILQGVETTYKKKKLPFASIVLPRLDEASLGALMQQKMIETVLVARLMGVNAFDQPAVESYKRETRNKLG